MKEQDLIKGLVQFGEALNALAASEHWPGYDCGLTETEFSDFKTMIQKEFQYNPWFTKENIQSALNGISLMLNEEKLHDFIDKYSVNGSAKKIAVIMAGNIPFVGFHDVLCILLSGNTAICKFSSNDQRIPPALLSLLKEWVPEIQERLIFSFGPLKEFDAVIATGSNNTILSLESYFKNVPRLFRKNRTSIAVLDGAETQAELEKLADDCFLYFGMGCRNVSKIFIPEGFNTDRLFEGFLKHAELINHHKYANNYDYQRTIMMMNQIPFLDNNAFMLKEDDGLHAPLSIIFYSYYTSNTEVKAFVEAHQEEIQIVVGHNGIPFGQAQCPQLSDYADGVDTMQWLSLL